MRHCLLALLIALLAACGRDEPQAVIWPTDTPAPTLPVATNTPSKPAVIVIPPSGTPIAYVPPTATLAPTTQPIAQTYVPAPNTPTPDVYRPPMDDAERLFRVLMMQAFAETLLRDTATELQAGRMDGMTGFFSIGTTAMALNTLQPALDILYFEPIKAHATVAITQQAHLLNVATRWIDKEITSADVPRELVTLDTEGEIVRYVDTLKAEGLTDSELQQMMFRLERDVEMAFSQ